MELILYNNCNIYKNRGVTIEDLVEVSIHT